MTKLPALALMSVVLSTPAFAEFSLVAPKAYEHAEAPRGVGAFPAGYPNGYRLQFVYDASLFDALPPSQRVLTGFYLRPDGLLGTPYSVSWPNLTLTASTTTVAPGDLTAEFNANFGADKQVVYDGPITFTTANTGPSGGPKDFDIAFEFQTPFKYDPGAGNLLIDWIVEGPAGWVGDDRGQPSRLSSFVANGNHWNSQFANESGLNDGVTRFRFVPEPTAACFACLGAVSLLAWPRRGLPLSPGNLRRR